MIQYDGRDDHPDAEDGKPHRDTRKRLDSALNEILLYVCRHLAPGWEIQITMTGHEDDGEAQIELTDPDGRDVSAEWDGESLNVWDMVDHSRQAQPEGENADEDQALL
jgi:hypothetical protein